MTLRLKIVLRLTGLRLDINDSRVCAWRERCM